jgi:hypothetical protein
MAYARHSLFYLHGAVSGVVCNVFSAH